jgi:hypothetical protein
MYVVCAFTLVGFLKVILPALEEHNNGSQFVWGFVSLAILLVVAAVMSALVAAADLEGWNAHDDGNDNEEVDSNLWEYKSAKFGPLGVVLNCLLWVPCVCCCCPWIPLLILLAGMTETIGVKESWFQLIAMVAGSASSIEGSGMLTATTGALAQWVGICGRKHCHHPWLLIGMQILIAIGTTMILIPAIAPLAPSRRSSSSSAAEAVDGRTPPPILTSAPTEDQALLPSFVPS